MNLGHINDTSLSDTMASHTPIRQAERVRSATWPPAKTSPVSPSTPSITISPPAPAQTFEADLEQNPERHFLSPMTVDECYGWDSDSDTESDDGEWHAGITDFALFAADRKRAMDTGEPLADKWTSFVESQGEVYQRSLARIQQSANEGDDVPGLTPDCSPNLRDSLEDDEETDAARPIMPQIHVQAPDYLTVEVKPAAHGALFDDDDELPLSFTFPRREPPRSTRVPRPGLRHARTLSGKKHVWRRPGWDMFTVGEDVIGEAEAEEEARMVGSTGALGIRLG